MGFIYATIIHFQIDCLYVMYVVLSLLSASDSYAVSLCYVCVIVLYLCHCVCVCITVLSVLLIKLDKNRLIKFKINLNNCFIYFHYY